jgi:hypothetical protein
MSLPPPLRSCVASSEFVRESQPKGESASYGVGSWLTFLVKHVLGEQRLSRPQGRLRRL